MSENNTNPAVYQFKSIRISMLQGLNAGKKIEIGDLVFGFTYYEDITKPFISANLNINDSGKNLIGESAIFRNNFSFFQKRYITNLRC